MTQRTHTSLKNAPFFWATIKCKNDGAHGALVRVYPSVTSYFWGKHIKVNKGNMCIRVIMRGITRQISVKAIVPNGPGIGEFSVKNLVKAKWAEYGNNNN